MDGASAEARGGRMPLVDSDGSNDEVMVASAEFLEVRDLEWLAEGETRED